MKKLFFVLTFFLILNSHVQASELKPIEQFNWNQIMQVPPGPYEGNQVLHFSGRNKPYENDPKATNTVKKYFQQAKALHADAEVLRFASDAVTLQNGFYLELGVGAGRTTNFLAALNPTKKIYGFDSFSGLPTDWDKGNIILKAGTFAFKGNTTDIQLLKNIIVFKGLFSDILPIFRQEILKESPIALLHIDSDIYQSAADAFNILGNNIVPGTIIVFDEFYNYPKFDEHEWQAFQEFVQKNKLKYQFIAYNRMHEQVAVKILG